MVKGMFYTAKLIIGMTIIVIIIFFTPLGWAGLKQSKKSTIQLN